MRAEVRAQRQAAAKAEADVAAVLRTQPPHKTDMQMGIARYAAFAHEFNVPGAANHESFCAAFNVDPFGGCSRPHVCPFKHEMPPSFDSERWRDAFNEAYRHPQNPYRGASWNRVYADFWDGYPIKCVRNQWPNGPNGFIECTYKGCEFYWTCGRSPTVQVHALRGACPCGNKPHCVTCRHMRNEADRRQKKPRSSTNLLPGSA